MRKFWTFISLVVLAAMVLAACGPAATPTTAPEVPPTTVPKCRQPQYPKYHQPLPLNRLRWWFGINSIGMLRPR